GDGLRHRRRARGARPHHAMRRQGRTGGLCAGGRRARSRAQRASRDCESARSGVRIAVARNIAGAERPDLGCGRGCRGRRGRLPQIEALPAVSLSSPAAPAIGATRLHVLPLRNHVVFMLILVAAAAAATCGFVSIAPNRLLSGQPVALWHAADPRFFAVILGCGALLLGIAFTPPRHGLQIAEAIIAAALCLSILAAAGLAAMELAASAPRLSRISLGAGFWIMLGAAGLAIL